MAELKTIAGGGAAVHSCMSQIEVLKTGPLMLIQDGGRTGNQHLGITVGGVADRHAAAWAHRLLGNQPECALLEICLGGAALRFTANTWFSITGADLNWKLDGRPLANWQSHQAHAGALLQAGMAGKGLRGYLAICGGIDLPPVCGSLATTLAEGMGGIGGRPLQSGDSLPCGQHVPGSRFRRQVPVQFRRSYATAITLRVVPSNQFSLFSQAQRTQFFDQRFRVSPASDRMGVRLDGNPLAKPPGKLISEPVCPGAIQVPANGLPIVLMQDCQTIGGYPKLGHVYRVDLDLLAQARPGVAVTFEPGSRSEAQNVLLQQRRFFLDGGRAGNG